MKACTLLLVSLSLTACQRGCKQTETDSPTVTQQAPHQLDAFGPRFGEFRPIGPAVATFLRFEANGSRVVYETPEGKGTKILSVACEGDPQELEVAHLEHEVIAIRCAASDDPCLILETQPQHPPAYWSSDPRDVVLVWRAEKRRHQLVDSLGNDAHLTSMSPDGKFAVVAGFQAQAESQSALRVLHFVNMDAPTQFVTYVHGEDWPEVESWQGSGADLRAIVHNGRYGIGERKSSWASVDPRSAAITELPAQPSTSGDTLSPDGRHRFSCNRDEEIVITDVASGSARRFALAPDERRALAEGCDVSWAGSRFLEFQRGRTAFIDIESFKVSFPFAEGAEPGPLRYDRDFRWAVATSGSQLLIAPVVVP